MIGLLEAQRAFALNFRTDIAAALLCYKQSQDQMAEELDEIERRFQERCQAICTHHEELQNNTLDGTISLTDVLELTKLDFYRLRPDTAQVEYLNNEKLSRNKRVMQQLMEKKVCAENSFFKFMKKRSIKKLGDEIGKCASNSIALIDVLVCTEQASAKQLMEESDAMLEELLNELAAEKDAQIAATRAFYASRLDAERQAIDLLVRNGRTLAEDLLSECIEDQSESAFPEFVMVGNWIERFSMGGSLNLTESFDLVYPCIVPLLPFKPVLFEHAAETEEAAGNFARLVCHELFKSIRPGSLRIAAVDPTGLGRNASMFLPTSPASPLVFAPTATTDLDIGELVDKLTKHIQNISETTLKTDTTNFFEIVAGGAGAEHSYVLLLIFGFPHSFNELSLQRLLAIVKNGPRCGILPVVVAETQVLRSLQKTCSEFTSLCFTVTVDAHRIPYFPFDDFDNCRFEEVCFPTYLEISEQIEALSVRTSADDSKPLDFSRFVPDAENWFSAQSCDSISVPIGCHYMDDKICSELVFDDQHMHVLIAGPIGSGKSNLLQVIICGLLLRYDPTEIELYLVDMKPGGVEFNAYAKARIPHARAVAVSHEPEFAIGVLKGLHSEMLKRNEQLFAEAGVSNIRDYIRKTGRKLPRIILVFDEFQNLFSNAEGDSLRQMQIEETKAHFNEIIRTSRSAGIHILLASQQFDRRHLDEQIRLNIRTRIALRASSRSESEDILGERNFAAVDLPGNRRGAAILNTNVGNLEANLQVLIPRIENSQIDTVIEASIDAGLAPNQQFFFQSREVKTLNQCPEAARLLSHPLLLEDNVTGVAYLGESIDIGPPVQINFRKRIGCNLLVVGSDVESAKSVVGNIAVQLLRQYVVVAGSAKTASVIFIDPHANLSAYCADRIASCASSRTSFSGAPEEWGDLIDGVYNELGQRMSAPGLVYSPVYLFLFGVQSLDFTATLTEAVESVRQTQQAAGAASPLEEALNDFPGFFDDISANRAPSASHSGTSLGQMVRDITEKGPRFGIHAICWADSLFALNNSFSGLRLNLDMFDMRVAMQMSEDDSHLMVRNKAAARLNQQRTEGRLPSGTCRVLLHCPSQNKTLKFRPFEMVSNPE